jgi:hypothetical protein
MRIGSGFCFALCLVTGLSAQIRGVGSVVNPAGGTGTPGVTRTLGSVVNPASGGLRVASPGQIRGISTGASRARTVYAYPVYIGGGYYTTPYISQDDSAAASPAQPNVTVVMPPQAPVTPVIINVYPGASTDHPDQANAPPQPAADDTSVLEPSHYLIAFKDHTIYAASAYWVDGDTLHYFTAGNTHNQASLALVDREFTERLNKEAGVDVKLPASAK